MLVSLPVVVAAAPSAAIALHDVLARKSLSHINSLQQCNYLLKAYSLIGH